MKAVYIKNFGGPENLEMREVAEPSSPDRNDILVRVKAAGLNRADLIQRRGHYPPPPGYSPHIPGLEFAGEVVEVGDGVSDCKKGDRVFGITAGEAQAEFLTVDHRLAVKIPDNLSFTEAAAVPEAFITAYDAVFTQGGLKAEETLLVHAVASGVGLAALQLGKAYGHRVIGTSRTSDKLARCEEFGLDEAFVVGSTPEFAAEVMSQTGGRGVNVILDLVGGSYFEQNLRSLASRGRLLLVGLTGGSTAEFNLGIALSKRATLIGTVLRTRSLDEKAEATGAFARNVLSMFGANTLRPVVDRAFSVSDVRAAHQYMESNESFGKIVLEF